MVCRTPPECKEIEVISNFLRSGVNLTPDLSFGYNLCVKCPNGSCKLILNIYVPKDFQWYKELFNRIGFDPCSCSLKIPKVGAHLRVWRFIPSHSLTLPRAWNVTLGFHTWPAPSQALPLVVSPKLRLWHWESISH